MERLANIMRRQLKISNFTVDPHYSDQTMGVPFHGDKNTIDYISEHLFDAEVFIETGTAYSDSSYYVASNFPELSVFTNEPWDERYELSHSVLKNCPNVLLSRTPSPEFLEEVRLDLEGKQKNLFDMSAVFWLDAHGDWIENDGTVKFSWPLPEEVDYITKNFKKYYIFIDDFYNPYNRTHKFDEYRNNRVHMICGPEMIKNSLNGAKCYHLNHTDITSKMQPFIVGIGLITNQNLIEHPEPIVEETFDSAMQNNSNYFIYKI